MVDLTEYGHPESKDTVTSNIVCPEHLTNPVWMIGDKAIDEKFGRLEDNSYLLDIRKATEEMDIESREHNLTFTYETKVGVNIFIRSTNGMLTFHENI